MRYLIFIFLIVFVSVPSAKGQNSSDQLSVSLRTGDLLFCSSTSGELSKAIDQSTQTGNNTHFDHIGIVEITNDTVWVLHAAPQKGVCREGIRQFILPAKKQISVTAYRLKPNYQKSIPAAIQKGRSLLGQSYNNTYILNDKGYYCSEYIYMLFSTDSIFTLNPMTFKDLKTGRYLTGWVSYYRKLGIPIPEGEPGCNPNGLAASEKLELIGQVKFRGKD